MGSRLDLLGFMVPAGLHVFVGSDLLDFGKYLRVLHVQRSLVLSLFPLVGFLFALTVQL